MDAEAHFARRAAADNHVAAIFGEPCWPFLRPSHARRQYQTEYRRKDDSGGAAHRARARHNAAV